MIPLRDAQRSYSKPVVNVLLIAVNCVAFLYELSLGPYARNELIYVYGLVPDRLMPISLVTSMFLHGGWLHIIGNMWFLWIFGDNIEDVLGHGRYLLFYLLCGVAAGLAHLATNLGSPVPTIGASGAIAGVMGAYLVKFPHSRIVTLLPLFIFWTTVEIPAFFILAYWFVIQLFSGATTIASHAQGGVAWFAHVGGFLTGILLIYVMKTNDPWRSRRDYRW